jgi:hypothetical protein
MIWKAIYNRRWANRRCTHNLYSMGYDLHITRKENWFDNDPEKDISLAEWCEYVSKDPEMPLDNFAEIEFPDGEVLRTEKEGICVWEKYSQDGIWQNHAWFSHFQGNIFVKNPDQEIINKMVDIAHGLNAKVQGDEGELYDKADYLNSNLENVSSKK